MGGVLGRRGVGAVGVGLGRLGCLHELLREEG